MGVPGNPQEKAPPELAQRIADKNEEIRRLLANEDAWAVETPGGSVLDNTPERTGYRNEPPPALTAS